MYLFINGYSDIILSENPPVYNEEDDSYWTDSKNPGAHIVLDTDDSGFDFFNKNSYGNDGDGPQYYFELVPHKCGEEVSSSIIQTDSKNSPQKLSGDLLNFDIKSII